MKTIKISTDEAKELIHDYKNQIFNRLEEQFGSELYPALASLSNIKK